MTNYLRCFSCGRAIIGVAPCHAVTEDGEHVYLGSECWQKVRATGALGYVRPLGGPRMLLTPCACGHALSSHDTDDGRGHTNRCNECEACTSYVFVAGERLPFDLDVERSPSKVVHRVTRSVVITELGICERWEVTGLHGYDFREVYPTAAKALEAVQVADGLELVASRNQGLPVDSVRTSVSWQYHTGIGRVAVRDLLGDLFPGTGEK